MAKKNGGQDVTQPKAATQEPTTSAATILGVDLKGELMDVEISKIIDPKGTPDRLARPGDKEAIDQLARSMKECGQLQPVMLEALADGRYCRVFGRRRLEAARLLGWTTIRASVVNPLADDVRRTIVAIENVQRQNLTAAEETLACHELTQLQALAAARQLAKPLSPECGALAGRTLTVNDTSELSVMDRKVWSHDAMRDPRVSKIASEMVAAMLGKTAEWVRSRLYVGRLSEGARRLVLEEKLPLAHAREIAKLGDPKRRDELAKAYAAGGSDSISDVEAGKLEDLQEEVRRHVFTLAQVPWKLELPVAGQRACVNCPNNSASSPGLFEVGGDRVSTEMVGGRGTYSGTDANSAKCQEAGVCTLPSCYELKLRATKAAVSAAAKRIVDDGRKPAEAKIPMFVRVEAVEAKARDRKKHQASSRRSSSKASGPASHTPAQPAKRSAKDVARDLHQQAMNEWHRAMNKEIIAAAKKAPLKHCLLSLIGFISGSAKAWHDPNKVVKLFQTPALAKVLSALGGTPSVHDIEHAWDRADPDQCDSLMEFDNIPTELMVLIAEKMKVGPELPKLDTFLAQAQKERDEEAKKDAAKSDAKPAGKKKAAKKSAKGRR